MNSSPFQKRWAILLALVVTGAAWMRAHAATTNITYGYYFFDPSAVQINVGDTVIWTNGTGTHTVYGTGADTICGGATLPCSHTFNTPGTYPYECTEPYMLIMAWWAQLSSFDRRYRRWLSRTSPA